MKIQIINAQGYEKPFFKQFNPDFGFALQYIENSLDRELLQTLQPTPAISCFVNDELDEKNLTTLHEKGCKLIVLRCSGYDRVNLAAAKHLGIIVTHVPSYSPHSIAEYTLMLILNLLRKLPQALSRVRQFNFALTGLTGTLLHEKVVGVVGTGEIGSIVIRILLAMGCRVIAYDPHINATCLLDGVEYVDIDTLAKQADIVTLHCALNPTSHHLITSQFLNQMKPTAILINTARGALIKTQDVLAALVQKQIAGYAADVYEYERGIFFNNKPSIAKHNDLLKELMAQPNTLITGHMAFLTDQALLTIVKTTLKNLARFQNDQALKYRLS